MYMSARYRTLITVEVAIANKTVFDRQNNVFDTKTMMVEEILAIKTLLFAIRNTGRLKGYVHDCYPTSVTTDNILSTFFTFDLALF